MMIARRFQCPGSRQKKLECREARLKFSRPERDEKRLLK